MASDFIDPEEVLIGGTDPSAGILSPLVPTGNTGTFTPVELADVLPFITVKVGGGIRDRHTWSPRLDLQVFAQDRPTGRSLIEDVDAELTLKSHWQFDRVDCISGPQEVHWPDDKCRLWVCAYQLVIRRKN